MKTLTLLLCAWVLWGKIDTDPSLDIGMMTRALLATWASIGAYEKLPECERQRRSGGAKTILLAEHNLMTIDETKAVLFTRCLPDTVDPRGVKR